MSERRRFPVLNVVDDVTRECLAEVPDTPISGRRVVRELAELIANRGKPGMIVSDNGTRLTSNAVLAWCGQIGVEWHCIAPGTPMQNGFCESSIGRMCDLLCCGFVAVTTDRCVFSKNPKTGFAPREPIGNTCDTLSHINKANPR